VLSGLFCGWQMLTVLPASGTPEARPDAASPVSEEANIDADEDVGVAPSSSPRAPSPDPGAGSPDTPLPPPPRPSAELVAALSATAPTAEAEDSDRALSPASVAPQREQDPPQSREARAPQVAGRERPPGPSDAEASPAQPAPISPALAAREPPASTRAEPRGARAREPEPEIRSPWKRALSLLGPIDWRVWGTVAGGVAAFGAIALLIARRRRGDVAVGLRYPDELAGTFRVTLMRRPGQVTASRRAEILEGRPSTRTRHEHVSRETRFPHIGVGRYVVRAEGFLRDPASGEVLEEVRRERVILVRAGRMVPADIEITPEHATLNVEVRWNDARTEALASVQGAEGGAISARGGRARLRLPLGHHDIAIGSGDRVALCPVEIDSFRPRLLAVDLGESDELVFKGCPPAVEPYVRGDFERAARALERDAQSREAKRVEADGLRIAGRLDEAARALEVGKHYAAAASLREELTEDGAAAQLWEAAGDHARAAQLYEKVRAWCAAGRAHERSHDFAAAIECYRRADDIPSWVSVLERLGRPFEAAELAQAHEDPESAMRLFQRVPPEDANFAASCQHLAELFESDQQWEAAAQKLLEYMANAHVDEQAHELRARVAELYERAGNLGQALQMLEQLRESYPSHPNVSTRIEVLRKRYSASRSDETHPTRKAPVGPQLAPTVVLSQPLAVVLDRYELYEKIGQGGMGEVYRARDRRLDRIVALKRISENLRDHRNAVELFLGEAQAAARLNHPHIVTVYDADQEDGIVFITMELLEGRPLHRVLHDAGRLAPEEVARLGSQVASGLDYAHRQGVIHRDVKTSNLFLVANDFVKLMDFGLAKITERVRRGSTLIGGTPYYMAPEQSAGGSTDPRTDLYGLGVTLFELSTGSLPFSDGDIAAHHRDTPPPDPREIAPALPDGLADLILSLLAKRVEERPPTAGQVAFDLRRWIEPA